MSVPAGTRFIGIQPGVDMVERKSSQANSPTEVYTIEDIQVNAVPYTGATGNVNLGEYELKAGQLTLDVSPTGTAAVGTTRWNNTLGSSETTLKGGSVILKNGVDLVARVVNKVTPNATLTKAAYQVVRVSGAQGQRLAVAYAQANNDNNSADTLGVVIETIPTNQEGFIMTVGQIEDINTTGSLQGETWADGDVLYLSPTIPGAITKVKPTGATGHIVIIGYVEYAHANNGKIYVKIMNGWELDELHNVYINPATLANNQVLTYESSTQLWKNQTPNTGITVGTTPSTGTNGRVFFQAGGVVQQDANFTFDNTLKRLTLKAVGTAATDIPFVVRNSADTSNLVEVKGDGSSVVSAISGGTARAAFWPYTAHGGDGFILSTTNTATNGAPSKASLFMTESDIRLFGTSGKPILNLSVNNTFGGTERTWFIANYNLNDGALYFGTTDRRMFLTDSATLNIGKDTMLNVQSGTNQLRILNGTAPTSLAADTFALYSADRGGVAGKASAHFRAEDGTINVIGDLSGFGTSAPGARLDVRAQGALSTDIAFRVRNSVDSANIFTVAGNNTIKLLSDPASANGIAISAGAFSAPLMTFSDVFGEVIRINAATSTVRSANFRSGSETGNGYFGIVNPSSQDRFLKFVNLFGLETLSIGGNNYDGDATFTLKSWSGAAATNIFTIARTDNTKPFVISNQANIGIGGTTFGASAQFVTAQYTGTAPTTSPVDAFQQYSADITAGNAAPHFRTENGAIVKVYQETTAVAASTLVGNAGTNITDTDTFDGYTLKQIVKALRNQGLLA